MNEFHRLLHSDPEYLLRTALTHDWDVAAAFCERILMLTKASTPPTTSSSVVKNKPPDMQQDGLFCFDACDGDGTTLQQQTHLALCRRQLQACDQYGNSVLQAACYYRPPVFLIERLLEAAIACHCRGALVRHTAVDQSTALQVACATGADIQVLQLLLVLPKSSDTEGEADDGCLTWNDQQGSAPVSELVVQYTLERQGPFHARRSRPLDEVMDVETERVESPIFRVFWDKLELLLRAAYRRFATGTSDNNFTMLAGAAAVASTCPTVLTSLLLRDHRRSAGRSTTPGAYNNAYQLLLLALGSNRAPSHAVRQRQFYEFVSLLVSECQRDRQRPHRVDTASVDRTLLTTAIRRGHTWPIVERLLSLSSRGLTSTTPRNKEVEWPLFLLAATSGRTKGTSDGDNNKLDTIFGLLRRLPQQALSACMDQREDGE